MIMIYYRDKKLKKKTLHVLEADIVTIKKTFIRCFLLKGCIFMGLVSVMNHCHINGLHLFWNTLYIYNAKFKKKQVY